MIPVTIKPVDPNKPFFPENSIPNWLSPEIRVVLKKHIKFMETQKNAPIAMREMFDLYAYLVQIFNKIKKAFTDIRMKPIWGKLNSLSKEKAADFAWQLLYRIENDYDGGLTLIEKHKAEIVSGNKIIFAAKKLFKEIENYQYWFYGHIIQENHDEFMDKLNEFVQNTTDSLDQFKKKIKSEAHKFSGAHLITRKSRNKSSLAIFYMRKIYLIFMELFKTPMYANISEIVNVIFDTEYTENHAIKYCEKIKSLIGDNSKE